MMRTREQQAAIETLAKRVCVDAGAGSGKTSVLVERIVTLIERGHASLDEIVAITFTEKAAAEMKIRLRKAFRAKAPKTDPEEMSRWRDMERRVETSRIVTIHSFCASLLREHALRIGTDPDFAVLAEAEAAMMKAETITDAVHTMLDRRDTSAVRAAAEFGTQQLSRIMAALLNKRGLIAHVNSDHPLGDAQALCEHWKETVLRLQHETLKTALAAPEIHEIRARLRALDGECSKPEDNREIARRNAVAAAESILGASTPSELQAAFATAADKKAISLSGGSKKAWHTEASFEDVKSAVEDLRRFVEAHPLIVFDDEVETRAAQLTTDVFSTFAKTAAAYENAKNARSARDFDDLLSMALAMLRDDDDIRTRTARGIKFLLIDEFQDTDTTQIEIARLLSDHDDGPSLFVVGDAKQSIYDFRGAEVEVFQQARSAAGEVIPLARNFRTVPEVLNFVNDFFRVSGMLRAVEPEYVPLETHREPVAERRIEFLIPELAENALADDYRTDEAVLIARRLDEMCRGGDRAEVFDNHLGKLRPAEFGDVALLFRAMSNVYLYEEALRDRGIPYNVIAGAGFYDRQEVIDFRNLLTVLVDPNDEAALLGFLRSPAAGISDQTLAQLCRGKNLVRSMRGSIPPELPQADRLIAARDLLQELRAHADMPLPAFLRRVLDRTGCEALLLTQFLGVQKAYNVRKVVELADDFARTRPAKLAAFVQYLAEVNQAEVREGDATLQSEGAGAVTLMTIHKSKGLEFPIVVVPDLSRERQAPDTRDVAVHRQFGLAARPTDFRGNKTRPAIMEAIKEAAKEKDAAENARILYVALTRARDWLLLGGSPKFANGSWMAAFDERYSLASLEHDAKIAGDGWSARVLRNAPAQHRLESPQKATEAVRWHEYARRADAVPLDSVSRRVFSVSALLDSIGFAPDEDDAPHSKAAAFDPLLRGTLVHRMFELWPFAESDVNVDALVASFLPRECPADDVRAVLEPLIREIGERFAKSEALARMKAAGAVDVEKPFVLRVGDALVNGTIDAILADGTLVDYKTGKPNDKKRQRYECQLRLYAAAVSRLLGRQPPSAFVYYADTAECMEVDVSPEKIADVMERTNGAMDTPFSSRERKETKKSG